MSTEERTTKRHVAAFLLAFVSLELLLGSAWFALLAVSAGLGTTGPFPWNDIWHAWAICMAVCNTIAAGLLMLSVAGYLNKSGKS